MRYSVPTITDWKWAMVKTEFSSQQQDMLFALEDESWWFTYRIRLIEKLLNKYFAKVHPIIDLGGGNGYSAITLQNAGWNVSLLEPSAEGCSNARKRGVVNVINGLLNKDFEGFGEIRQMVLLDVLEHIEDDRGMLGTIYDGLAKGGKLLVTVPAFTCLWSSEDDAAGHFRRYKRKALRKLMEDAGFNVLYSSYFFSFLFFPIYIIRHVFEKLGLIKKVKDRSKDEELRIKRQQFGRQNFFVERILKILESLEEKRILSGKTLGIGSSIVIVCEKPL